MGEAKDFLVLDMEKCNIRFMAVVSSLTPAEGSLNDLVMKTHG